MQYPESNEQTSEILPITIGVLLCSVLEPFLCLVYINDLPKGVKKYQIVSEVRKSTCCKKAISRLVNNLNQTITDQKEIMKELSDFCRNLRMQPFRKFDKQSIIHEFDKQSMIFDLQK